MVQILLHRNRPHHRLLVFARMPPGTVHRLAIVVDDKLAAIRHDWRSSLMGQFFFGF